MKKKEIEVPCPPHGTTVYIRRPENQDPNAFGAKPNPNEGAHFYAFSALLTEDGHKYTKAMATITIPKGNNINFGPTGLKRNAYIALGALAEDSIGTVSLDMGLCNQKRTDAGWQPCFGGFLSETEPMKDANNNDVFIPSYVDVVTLLAEDISTGNQNSIMRLTVGYINDKGKPEYIVYDKKLDKKYNWQHFYRFASLMYNQTCNPCSGGSKMTNIIFSDLGLYDANTGKYDPWGMYTPLVEYAWIVDYPYGSFSDGKFTNTSEVFNINNNG